MRGKGCRGATTIHSLIYRLRGEDEDGPNFRPQRRQRRRQGRADRHRRMLDGGRGDRPRSSFLRHAGARPRRSGAASADRRRRLLHRRRARRDADRGPPPGGRRPDHPPVDDRARRRRARPWPLTARAASSAATTSMRRRCSAPIRCWSGGTTRGEATTRRIRELLEREEPGAGRRRHAGLPQERPQARPAQRQPLAGRAGAEAAKGPAHAIRSRRRKARRASAAPWSRSIRPSSTARSRR